MITKNLSRKEFLQISFAFASISILASCTHLRMGKAMIMGGSSSNELVDEKDAVAKNLNYVHCKDETHPPLQTCDNCKLYVPIKDNPTRGKCRVIDAGLVTSKGWCRT